MTFDISLTPIQFGFENGSRFEVYPEVKNPEITAETDTVTLSVDGTERDSRDVTLSPTESERVKLAWTVDISDNAELPVTVSTSSDSASDKATFHLYNDVIRLRFNSSTRESDISHEEKFVNDTTNIGEQE